MPVHQDLSQPPTDQPAAPVPVIGKGLTFASVTDKIGSIVLARGTPWGWLVGFSIGFLLLMLLGYTIGRLIIVGIGIWGVMIPVAWGFAITDFVWWIGIGHAGTLISAILLLLNQHWRTSINRFAEAMTIFAVMCAGLFPLMHLGRPWFFYFLIPYPNTMAIWPNFRSPLVWDVFAVSTYFTVSVLFWYVGMISDMATLRDRARNVFAKIIFGILAMGWRNSAYHWKRYEMAYVIMGALATPLVVSVHTVVSFDFAVALLPGWHSTIFPPYFVAGAIYSGFAMVLVIAIPLRAFYGLEDYVTMRHLENCAKLMLLTGLMVGYAYMMEPFMAWYSNNIYEWYQQRYRPLGVYRQSYWALITCNILLPQFLWIKKVRTNIVTLFLLSLVVLVGMWIERYVIIIISLSRDFLPSSWGVYSGTMWDWSALAGSCGLFVTMMFLFIRFLPMISIAEMRKLLPQAAPNEEAVHEELPCR